ncbi:MAG TPA: pitrilysin family protein, partial [Saprospiraceae bacterium]|nr:pitrilysin family protein [Saprospiraceae bacterium]
FRAGASKEKKIAVAEFMAGQLSEGTQQLSSADFAEKIEFLGATLQTRGGVDTIRIKLYTLSRFLPQLIELIRDIILYPSFDEQELKVYTNNKIERLQIELKKNDVLAYRHLTEAIYGKEHPYGRNALPQDYQAITVEDMVEHHRQFILPQNGMIFLSGSYDEEILESVKRVLGTWGTLNENGSGKETVHVAKSQTGYIEIDGPQSHQAAIRIGRKLFTQDHPDWNGLYVLNTILGGYFGSRLMTEIRENLGLTYGIYSGMDSFAEDGCFYISTETTTENIKTVIEAIKIEAAKLKQTLIPEPELRMARNYLMGHLMTQLDGPFATLDFIKSMKIERLPDETFSDLVNTIQQITSNELRELAIRYLDLDQWVTIVIK